MTNLTDIPTEDFPLNYDEYCDIRNRLVEAASGFERLGTVIGRQLNLEIMEAHGKLGRAWESIRNEERREIERKANGVSVRAR